MYESAHVAIIHNIQSLNVGENYLRKSIHDIQD